MDNQLQIILVIVAQIFTLAAVFFTSFLNRRNSAQLIEQELRTRKRAEYLEEQLFKLYGPISILLHMNKALLKLRFNLETNTYSNAVPEALWQDVRDNVIRPNNFRIVRLLKKNFHLLEGSDIPDSVMRFIVHAEVFALQHKHNLANETYLKDFRFPVEFEQYIFTTTNKVKKEYLGLVSEDKIKIHPIPSKTLAPPRKMQKITREVK
ncbi:hypothetical protein LARV_01043 [Longilinea arvoryzae]|uniref:Uncharacterized protein n=1 Tax=Longilinea arvoryzae TaxID=360412 RepID=A0A0S7BI97_9CHLR|nr:hypothetical protein [Longilinea arvoryzae]GAP13290.1 hypothetical protein LARV_01043 [Longilinea arvoryzae]